MNKVFGFENLVAEYTQGREAIRIDFQPIRVWCTSNYIGIEGVS